MMKNSHRYLLWYALLRYAKGCTTVVVNATGGGTVIGRTMELGIPLPDRASNTIWSLVATQRDEKRFGYAAISAALGGALVRAEAREERREWRFVGDEGAGSWLFLPPSTPWAVVHFVGGAALGAVPQLCYDGLLRGLYLPGIEWNVLAVASSQGVRLGLYPSVRGLLVPEGARAVLPDAAPAAASWKADFGDKVGSSLIVRGDRGLRWCLVRVAAKGKLDAEGRARASGLPPELSAAKVVFPRRDGGWFRQELALPGIEEALPEREPGVYVMTAEPRSGASNCSIRAQSIALNARLNGCVWRSATPPQAWETSAAPSVSGTCRTWVTVSSPAP